MTSQLALTDVDDGDLGEAVLSERTGHVERDVRRGGMTQLVLVGVKVLLAADHLEDVGERRLGTDATDHLLVARQVHRQPVRDLRRKT